MEIISKSPSQTKKIGEIFAQKIISQNSSQKWPRLAIILGLEGDLGGGKTTFLQGFTQGLGIKEKILSPTFVIMKRFNIRANSCLNSCKFASFYHIDCYRIKKPKEILDLGFKEIISDPKNIVAIEWAEKIKKILPKNAIGIKFAFLNKNSRKITIRSSLKI